MAADGAFHPAESSSPSSVALPVRPAARHAAVTFLIYASPFFFSGFCYEAYRRLVPLRGEIHVADLHAFEAWLFSVPTSAGPRAISDIVATHTHPIVDVVTGITYFLFMLEVFVIAGYLFFRSRTKMFDLSFSFVLMNLAGWSLWLVYPAAPPWYVDQYGLGPAVLDAASSPAGLARLDALLGIPLAADFYAKSANVFGAMPSLHCAYATLVACMVFPMRGALRWGTVAFAVSMAFSAIYLRHHYILDVLGGVLLAIPFAVYGPLLAGRVRRAIEAAG
jgi:inositol phosphorylceramide synthase catalytic subunit